MKVMITSDEWCPVYELVTDEPDTGALPVVDLPESDVAFIRAAFASFDRAQQLLRDAYDAARPPAR